MQNIPRAEPFNHLNANKARNPPSTSTLRLLCCFDFTFKNAHFVFSVPVKLFLYMNVLFNIKHRNTDTVKRLQHKHKRVQSQIIAGLHSNISRISFS